MAVETSWATKTANGGAPKDGDGTDHDRIRVDRLQRMESGAGGEVVLLIGMVGPVQSPEPGNPMKQVVLAVGDEVQKEEVTTKVSQVGEGTRLKRPQPRSLPKAPPSRRLPAGRVLGSRRVPMIEMPKLLNHRKRSALPASRRGTTHSSNDTTMMMPK
jgi:hypothetical protein